MLNYEKRIAELESEKEKTVKKLQEIQNRFTTQIELIQKNIDVLNEKRQKLAELSKEEMDILTSANELASQDVRKLQEGKWWKKY